MHSSHVIDYISVSKQSVNAELLTISVYGHSTILTGVQGVRFILVCAVFFYLGLCSFFFKHLVNTSIVCNGDGENYNH